MTVRPVRLVIACAAAAVVLGGCLPSGTRGGPLVTPATPGAPTASASPAPSGPTPIPTIVAPTPTPAPTFFVYTVVRGDSLNSIAHQFKTTARSIAFWNRSTYPSLDPEGAHYRPDLLEVGWTLFLLPNEVVDEQELPEPSDASESDPADGGAVPSDEGG
jgi:nucleoid-associated protein YgaU